MNKNIIAIINQKGGVGKTTTSINFAAGLARKGKKTLLVDLDPQAHSTIGLGIEQESFSASISDVLAKKKPIKETILKTRVENLFIVPSHIRLDKIEQQLSPELFRETFLKKALNTVDFDYIIIDTSPIGAVADSYLLMKYASQNLLIARQDYTKKEIFAEVVKGLETNKQTNYDIVFNDLNYKKSSYGRYYGTYYDEGKGDVQKKERKASKKMSKIV